jgi:small-conductance mechanosensitive channel
MNQMAARLGFELPSYPALVSAGAALAIVFAAWLLAILAGRTIGPALSRFWSRYTDEPTESMTLRMCRLVRFAAAALMLAVALRAESWPPLSAFILGFSVAASAALLVIEAVRGLDMPRWAAVVLAGAAFLTLLADALKWLRPVTNVLDRVSFDAGKTHVSLLSAIQVGIIILAIYAVVKLITRLLNASIKQSRSLDPAQQLLVQKLGSVVLLVVAFFVGIDLIGIDLTALTVFSGAFGLAVGFGLQKTFGNLIAGIILLMDRSVKPGDVIVVGESFGYVTKIGVRAVSIVTRDGKEHLIPNENLMTQEVENWSYSNPNVRIHIPVSIAYDSDVELAQKLMIEAALTPSRVLKSPKPVVWLLNLGENALEHEIRVWIKDPEGGIGNVRSEILSRLWVLFKENGIRVPSPQRDVQIKEWTGSDVRS